ncbi:formyl-CoA transferase domain protein [Mycobacterium xenopi 4042]|uniref:Formyl-CoA transferase domain protein n=1 Tax=Mycobacterium xenopi 4042 TaxID=1299334 RepID=X8AEU9_MYCXE|nr:formyl-CoA transferase domain protein [Mycobacterium xenopi 4042]
MEPLNGYVVIDLSTGIAGAYCTKLLADGGAQVIKVEPPQGDPLRQWSASGSRIQAGSDGALFSFLACSKHSVVADAAADGDVEFVQRLLSSADAVIWSRGSAIAEHPSLAPTEIHRAHPTWWSPRSHRSGWTVPGMTAPQPNSRCRRGRAGSSRSDADLRTGRRYSSAARSVNISPEPTPAQRRWHSAGSVADLSTSPCWKPKSSASPITRSPTSRCSADRGETPERSPCQVSRRPKTGWLTSAAEPLSSGSIYAQ